MAITEPVSNKHMATRSRLANKPLAEQAVRSCAVSLALSETHQKFYACSAVEIDADQVRTSTGAPRRDGEGEARDE